MTTSPRFGSHCKTGNREKPYLFSPNDHVVDPLFSLIDEQSNASGGALKSDVHLLLSLSLSLSGTRSARREKPND